MTFLPPAAAKDLPSLLQVPGAADLKETLNLNNYIPKKQQKWLEPTCEASCLCYASGPHPKAPVRVG